MRLPNTALTSRAATLRNDVRFIWAAGRPAPVGGHDAPPLPPGRPLQLPGRGETFVRELAGPTGRLPVVLLHGWTWTSDLNFFGAYELIAREHPVIGLDTRNHGRGLRVGPFAYDEVADDVVATLDALGIDRAIIAGYSLGGVTSIVTALRHPSRVAGIVPQACALSYTTLPRDRMVGTSLAALARAADRPALAGLSSRIFHDSLRTTPEMASRWGWIRDELARTSTRDMIETASVVFTTDLNDEASRLSGTVPSAYLALTRDRVCRTALQREAASVIGASVVEVAADHDLPVAAPQRYADAVVETLALLRSEIARH